MSRLTSTFGFRLPLSDLKNANASDLLNEHKLLVIDCETAPTVPEYVDLCQSLGEPILYHLPQYSHKESELVTVLSNRKNEKGEPLGLVDAGSYWHSDLAFQKNPARFTCLLSVEIPEEGGNTAFCDMEEAYRLMPEGLRNSLEGVHTLHAYLWRFKGNTEKITRTVGGPEAVAKADIKAVHPAAIARPELPEKTALFLNPGFSMKFIRDAQYVAELKAKESFTSEEVNEDPADASLRKEVLDYVTQFAEANAYWHKWSVPQILIWDNSSTIHKATTDVLPSHLHRTMWRMVVGRTTPVAPQ